jgi:hypothetical protein
MNKQQGYSILVGAVITLGSITAVAAGNPPWRYDEESNRVIFAFTGPDIPHSAVADNDMNNRQTANLPWHYDEASRRVIFAFTGPATRHPM